MARKEGTRVSQVKNVQSSVRAILGCIPPSTRPLVAIAPGVGVGVVVESCVHLLRGVVRTEYALHRVRIW